MSRHNRVLALVPPGDPRRGGPDGWRCVDCDTVGGIDDLISPSRTDCTRVSVPCRYCGEINECAFDCRGVALALSAPDVYVTAGLNRPKARLG